MKRLRYLLMPLCITIVACGGGGSGGSSSGVAAPIPPPATDMSAAGIWIGQAVTPDVPDVVTGFEFDDADGFVVGDSPFEADFQGGVAESRSIPGLYIDGINSWHIAAGTDGTVTFGTAAPSMLSFSTRTVTAGDDATIVIKDVDGVDISSDVVADAFQQITITRDPATGESLIGSVTVTVAAGEIVIDALTFGYPSAAATDDIACVIAPANEFVCILTDATSGDFVSGANGTIMVSGDQVTGSGNLYAARGETLADGSTIAPLTISAGTVAENTTLDLTVDAAGVAIAMNSAFDDTYNRGGDLATVEAVYSTLEIFGGASSFEIDAAGAITGQLASGCVLSGQVSVIDAAVNAYDVSLSADAATCGALAGDYDGLGVTADDNAMDDQFVFGVFVDGQLMILADAIK